MNNKELPRGRQTLDMARTERVRGGGITHPPIKEEAAKANAGEYAGSTRTVKRVGGSKILKAVLAGSAVVGAGALAYEAVPAVHQAVDSAFLDHIKGNSLSSEASTNPEVFDPTARSGVIKPSMIERLPQEEIDKLDPFEKISDHNTVLGIYPLDISKSSKSDAELNFLRRSGGANEQDRLDLTKKGFLNSLYVENIPQGTLILAPVDGNLTVFTASGNSTPINDLDFSNAAIDFLVDGEEFRLIISGGIKKNGTQTVLKNLTNAPIGSGMSPEEALQVQAKAIPVKKGTPIFQAATNNMVAGFDLRGNFDRSKDEIKIINGKEVIFLREAPTNLEFFSSPNGKILIPTQ